MFYIPFILVFSDIPLYSPFMSKHYEKFDQVVSSYGCYDGFQVGLAGPISKWDEAKFKKRREEETKDFTGKMGYVKLGSKGRRGGEGRRYGHYGVVSVVLKRKLRMENLILQYFSWYPKSFK